jgi:predicted short-subunit dehydrogenase-like oxidoreductase (DUF2520 family)
MSENRETKIVIVGCGNVAWHLAAKLSGYDRFRIEVYNHRTNSALDGFRKELKCKTVVGLNRIPEDASFYFICVPDKFIRATARYVTAKDPRALLLHTSGSAPIGELGERVHDTGVFYPLQTFSRESTVAWNKVPLILEASSEEGLMKLHRVGKLFSTQLYPLAYKHRLKLHLAAVLVNNFTNALYVMASDLLEKEKHNAGMDFDMLLPLIRQTTAKVMAMGPAAAQTGPAKRKDTKVMKKHLSVLGKKSEVHQLYQLFSKIIIQQQRAYAELQGKAK